MVYLLEDDDNIRKLVLYTFDTQGIEAMGFMKPSEFWLQMKNETPDLILLDIMLPEEDDNTGSDSNNPDSGDTEDKEPTWGPLF